MSKTIQSTHKHTFALQILAVTFVNIVIRFFSYPWLPKYLVFDEKYYVPQVLGMFYRQPHETVGEAGFRFFENMDGALDIYGSSERAVQSIDTFQHPPFGKWLIGLGTLFFDDSMNPSAWRLSSVVASILLAVMTMIIVKDLLPKFTYAPLVTGVLFTADGQFLTMGRLGMLDIFVALFVALGVVFFVKTLLRLKAMHDALNNKASTQNKKIIVIYSILSGISFGLAVAVKWNALTWLAIIGITLLVMAIYYKTMLPFWSAVSVGLSSILSYVTSWFLLPVQSTGFFHKLIEIFDYHMYIARFMLTEDSPSTTSGLIPFPLSWIVQKSQWGYSNCNPQGTAVENCSTVINSGNVVLWVAVWISVAAVLVLVSMKKLPKITIVAPVMFVAGVLPWLSGIRTPWLSYSIQILPFGVISLVIFIWFLWTKTHGSLRIVCIIFTILLLTTVFVVSVAQLNHWL